MKLRIVPYKPLRAGEPWLHASRMCPVLREMWFDSGDRGNEGNVGLGKMYSAFGREILLSEWEKLVSGLRY